MYWSIFNHERVWVPDANADDVQALKISPLLVLGVWQTKKHIGPVNIKDIVILLQLSASRQTIKRWEIEHDMYITGKWNNWIRKHLFDVSQFDIVKSETSVAWSDQMMYE